MKPNLKPIKLQKGPDGKPVPALLPAPPIPSYVKDIEERYSDKPRDPDVLFIQPEKCLLCGYEWVEVAPFHWEIARCPKCGKTPTETGLENL